MAARSRLKGIDPEQIRHAIQPLAAQLPSVAMDAEILPPETPPAEPATADEYAAAIGRLWTTAQETFLDIGRLLDTAQRLLPPDGYTRLCEALPFGKSARSQLLSAWRLIGAGVLPPGVERAGYATIYLCATLTEREREQAIREGVIRPAMQKNDIVAFRRRVRTVVPDEPPPQPEGDDPAVGKRAELERLRAERERIDARIRALEEELRGG